MHVSVYSLKKVLFEDEAAAINCQTEAGELTILDKHAPLLTVLKPGAIKITDKANKEHFIDSKGVKIYGFCH